MMGSANNISTTQIQMLKILRTLRGDIIYKERNKSAAKEEVALLSNVLLVAHIGLNLYNGDENQQLRQWLFEKCQD